MSRPKTFRIANYIIPFAALPVVYAFSVMVKNPAPQVAKPPAHHQVVNQVSRAARPVLLNAPGAKKPDASEATDETNHLTGNWPPRKGMLYPNLVLKDQNGELVRLRDFAGRPILVELAAVSCAGCQALAGGNKVGGFLRVRPQKGVSSIHESAQRFAKVRLGQDREVVFVQLLLYGKRFSSPTSEEVSGWAKHFRMKRNDRSAVLQSTPDMLSMATYHMIPGFHLINKDFVLTHDSSGHSPGDDLYRDLLPALGEMANAAVSVKHTALQSSGVQTNAFAE